MTIYDLDPVKFKTLVKEKGKNMQRELNPDLVISEMRDYTEIVPGVWTPRAMGNQTKVEFLKEFAISYGIGFDDVAFITKKR